MDYRSNNHFIRSKLLLQFLLVTSIKICKPNQPIQNAAQNVNANHEKFMYIVELIAD